MAEVTFKFDTDDERGMVRLTHILEDYLIANKRRKEEREKSENKKGGE